MDKSGEEEVVEEIGKCVFLEEFKEHEEIEGIIASTTHIYSNQIAVEMALERFLYVIDQYQEQPHLLDPHLGSLLGQLLAIVKDKTVPNEVIHLAFRMLYLITKTRGYKVIVRMMPHEVADLEPLLSVLTKLDPDDLETWQSRYMLFLWLSIVAMIPFDMCRLDGIIAGSVEADKRPAPIMERIINVGKVHLCVIDKSRDSAAYMLSRFVTRPDVRKLHLPSFLDWVLITIKEIDRETLTGQTYLCGLLTLLAAMYKHGKREDLVEFAPTIHQHVMQLELHKSRNMLLRKLFIKLVQRLGLSFLKARLTTWRYQRGNRSLADNLSATKSELDEAGQSGQEKHDEDEDYEIPDSVEEIIGSLLSGLKDKDTVVRWSSAKGIGRITGRLYRSLADEVVGAIMELFSPTETECAWHGGCLALAELGRRGLLLPSRLPLVVPIIAKALIYDEKCGNFSFGSNVRDAACYVCWSFARAYDALEIAPYVNTIASLLVVVSVFDREVNIRRAAAAAFQENVGRQGQFPHGIEILSTCDYFAVGNRKHCYLELSVFVAQFEEYTVPLIDHLVQLKINHWDIAMRELTAESLSRLTPKSPQYMALNVLPMLLEKCLDPDLDTHHGALLAVAHVVHGLFKLHIGSGDNQSVFDIIDISSQSALKDLTGKMQELRYFKGSSGDMMRKAVCCLIEKLSQCKLPFHGTPVIDVWQNLIDECLSHIDPDIQAAAVHAIPSFFTEYYTVPDGKVNLDVRERILSKYLKELSSNVETTRSGFSLALGALPATFLSGCLDDLLTRLFMAAQVSPKQSAFVACRRDAIKALASVCKTVGFNEAGAADEVICRDNIQLIYNALFAAMKDYTLDSRGDVGTWVREAAMTGLHDITSMLVSTAPQLLSPEMSRRMFCELMQQACEKIDRTRAHAGGIFARLLYHRPEVPHIPHRDEVTAVFPQSELATTNWATCSDTFPKFASLLSLPTYTYSIMLGLIVSAGGLTESLVKHGCSSLRHYISTSDAEHTQQAINVLLAIFRDYQKVERVTLPMLKTLDHLLTSSCFSSVDNSDCDEFAASLVSLTKAEISRCGDVQRLLAAIDVFCDLLQFSTTVKKSALTQLMLLLCHSYPIVRKNSAFKLYEAAITYEGVIPDEAVDEVTSLLVETLWDEPVDVVRAIRNQLCDLLGVKRPVMLSKATVVNSTQSEVTKPV